MCACRGGGGGGRGRGGGGGGGGEGTRVVSLDGVEVVPHIYQLCNSQRLDVRVAENRVIRYEKPRATSISGSDIFVNLAHKTLVNKTSHVRTNSNYLVSISLEICKNSAE